MLMTRILVIMQGISHGETAALAVLSALSNAASSFSLRFAVDQQFEDAFTEITGEADVFQAGDILFYDESKGISGILPLLTDETHFLFLIGAHHFAPKWDRILLSRYKKIKARNYILTGIISSEDEHYPPQAYLPAFAQNFDESGVLIQRGLPLVCSAAPVSTLAIHPALLFGQLSFLHRVPWEPSELSIAAYLADYTPYALDQAIFWPIEKQPTYRLRGLGHTLPGTSVARFEQLAGFRYEQKAAGVKTTWGLFTKADTYPQLLPRSMILPQKAKLLAQKLREDSNAPLIATAFIDLPNPRKPVHAYVLRFGFMKNLLHLPLLLFASGGQERYLRSIFPNVCSYPRESILSRTYLRRGMMLEDHMRRSKFHLMMNAARKHEEFTHVAWANADLIRDPICPDAMPDFTHLMDEKVHMAMVHGTPDTSFILMPISKLEHLVALTESITLEDSEKNHGLSEAMLIKRLIDTFPELFTLHEFPKKHLLMHTAFAPELLSQRYQALLGDSQLPWRQRIHNQQEVGR